MNLSLLKLITRSLRVKFLLLILVILVLLATLISVGFINLQLARQRQEITNGASSFAKLSVKPLASTFETYFDSGYLKFKEITEQTLALNKNIKKIQIISVTGIVVFDSTEADLINTEISDKVTLQAIESDKKSEFKKSKNEIDTIIEPYFDDFAAHPLSIRYFVSYSALNDSLTATIAIAFGISLLVAVISGLLVVFTVNKTIISPTEKIVTGARLVSEGQLDSRIELTTGDELENLANSVNNMANSLQKNIEALKSLDKLKDEFIIIASHNLRTPLTVLKGYISQLVADPKASKTNKDKYKAISVSVSKLESLVEEFLSIVSLESDKKISAESKIDLASIINQVISVYSPAALAKKISLHFVSQNESYFINGDSTRLKLLFNNLVENAIKFNKDYGSVTITIIEEKEDFVVSVKDNGIGISEKEIPLVFKKFHRATDILTYNYQGLGLGLYLSRVIAEAHGGKIWFESNSGKGSTFSVRLPKMK